MTSFVPASHPGQSDYLVHFCSRSRATTSGAALAYLPSEPEGRLGAILREGAFRAFAPYGTSAPAVCFSESDIDGIAVLLRRHGWAPWGLVFRREWVWGVGGGPVWYVRTDVKERLFAEHPHAHAVVSPWMVRTQPGEADWLHERELAGAERGCPHPSDPVGCAGRDSGGIGGLAASPYRWLGADRRRSHRPGRAVATASGWRASIALERRGHQADATLDGRGSADRLVNVPLRLPSRPPPRARHARPVVGTVAVGTFFRYCCQY